MKSSLIVLDSKLQMKSVPELDGLKVQQVAETQFLGYLFAVDADQNLIAIDIKLVCQGVKPCKIMSYEKQGNSRTLLSIDHKNVWLLLGSG